MTSPRDKTTFGPQFYTDVGRDPDKWVAAIRVRLGTDAPSDRVLRDFFEAVLGTSPRDARIAEMEKELDSYSRGLHHFMQETGRLEAALTAERTARETAERRAKQSQADLTMRAKIMLRLRDKFVLIRDELEDEGDRVYFGSTNDADEFKAVVEQLDGLAWDDIIRDGKQDDVYKTCREQVVRALAAEALITTLQAELDRARAATIEECAKLAASSCDKYGFWPDGEELAARIRSLAEPKGEAT